MKLNSALRALALAAGVTWGLAGCASPQEHSFNSDFQENLPTDPKYYIEDESDSSFKIVVHEGSPSTGAERVINQKEAATTVAKSETTRLGWVHWHLDYIQERDQGWMHIVIAKVIHD